MKNFQLAGGALFASLVWIRVVQSAEIEIVDRPDVTTMNRHYVGNRAPLAPSPFVKLPIGNITPRGWLRHKLEIEKDGMTGRLKEISPWLDFEKSSWADKEGKGALGWEEMPYWLKGYGDLGYVLKDEVVIAEAKKWIEAAMASQREDGWFGPRDLLTSLKGKPDLWPHMVMLNILQSYYEFSGDRRVLDVMTRYMKWQNTLPRVRVWRGLLAEDPRGRQHRKRALALQPHRRSVAARPGQENPPRHGPLGYRRHQLAQRESRPGFPRRHGGVDGDEGSVASSSAERNYTKLMGLYGQFPGGGFVGDENCRPGFVDPRGGIETCGIVEFMHSFEMLMKITGNPLWADRCEEIAFNSFPASMTPDQKGLALHHLRQPGPAGSPQQVAGHPERRDDVLLQPVRSLSLLPAQRLARLAVLRRGTLARHARQRPVRLALRRQRSQRQGRRAATTVKITEETDYPFSDTITFRSSPRPRPVKFPALPARAALVRGARDDQRPVRRPCGQRPLSLPRR